MILKNFFAHLIQPFLKESRLPEPGQVICSICASEIFDCCVLSIGSIRPECGRRTGAEVMYGVERPWFPHAGEWRDRSSAAPHARRWWKGTRKHLVRSIALSVGDD